MARDPKAALARIVVVGADGGIASVRGAGFHAGGGHVVTCAHVLNLALGRDWRAPEPPSDAALAAVRAAFPNHGDGRPERVTLAAWRPPAPESARRRDQLCDVAVLRVAATAEPLPAAVELSEQAAARGARFDCWGFPLDRAGQPRFHGALAEGAVLDPDVAGWMEVRDAAGAGYFLQPGFSGGAAFAGGKVIGMAAAGEPDRGLSLLIPARDLARAWPPLARPYQRLAPFTEATARYFFGREDETAVLLDKVRRWPVVGASGSGKSSLVQAGLVPRLRDAGWRIGTMRPGADPLQALGRALDVGDAGHDALRRLAAEVADGTAGARLLIAVDQLEELFKPALDAVRWPFLDLLFRAASGPEQPVRVALTLRSDFVTPLLWDGRTSRVLNEAGLWLGPVTRDGLRRAIERPAAAFGVTFAPELVETLVADAAAGGGGGDPDGGGGRLPLLQFALAQLWERQDPAARVVPSSAYGEPPAGIGGLAGALERHAREVLGREFGGREGPVLRVLTRLAEPDQESGDVRRVATRAEIGDEDWREIVVPLADHRLLTTDRREDGADTVEVVHEALLRAWPDLPRTLDAQREFRLWRQRLGARAAEWEREADPRRKEAMLLGGVLLEEAASRRELHRAELGDRDPTDRAIVAFVAASRGRQEAEREERERRERRLRDDAFRQASLLLALLAERQRERGQGRRAVLLALEALPRDPGRPERPVVREARAALARGLHAPLERVLLRHEGAVLAVAFSPDGARLATGGDDGTARLWRVLRLPLGDLAALVAHARALHLRPLDGEERRRFFLAGPAPEREGGNG